MKLKGTQSTDAGMQVVYSVRSLDHIKPRLLMLYHQWAYKKAHSTKSFPWRESYEDC